MTNLNKQRQTANTAKSLIAGFVLLASTSLFSNLDANAQQLQKDTTNQELVANLDDGNNKKIEEVEKKNEEKEKDNNMNKKEKNNENYEELVKTKERKSDLNNFINDVIAEHDEELAKLVKKYFKENKFQMGFYIQNYDTVRQLTGSDKETILALTYYILLNDNLSVKDSFKNIEPGNIIVSYGKKFPEERATLRSRFNNVGTIIGNKYSLSIDLRTDQLHQKSDQLDQIIKGLNSIIKNLEIIEGE